MYYLHNYLWAEVKKGRRRKGKRKGREGEKEEWAKRGKGGVEVKELKENLDMEKGKWWI